MEIVGTIKSVIMGHVSPDVRLIAAVQQDTVIQIRGRVRIARRTATAIRAIVVQMGHVVG